MIILSSKPYNLAEINKLKEQFEVYIKTVIGVERKICVAGMDRHFEGEQMLINDGSFQSDIWGGGIDLETLETDYNSFINIRPNDNNLKNEIQSEDLKKMYKELTEYFFSNLYV
ncbi:hypothetical protein HZB78_01255 [Candidatus Collierbacteria bacterium]|nr:hypothetical protein [Candidatus Collierbacteria bacterium]